MTISKVDPCSSASSSASERRAPRGRRGVGGALCAALGIVSAAAGNGLLCSLLFASPSRVEVIEPGEAAIARQLAEAVAAVRERFAAARRVLPRVEGPRGEEGYAVTDLARLVQSTAADLDQAIQKAGEPGLEPLRDWAATEIDELRRVLGAPGPPAGGYASPSGPPARVALFKSLRPFAGIGLARVERVTEASRTLAGTTPMPRRIDGKRSEDILDRLAELLRTIFVLSRKRELQVTVRLALLPQSTGDLVLYASQHVCEPGKERGLTRGRNVGVWRGLYRFEPRTTADPKGPCPSRSEMDWLWSLDLVRSGGSLRCDFTGSKLANPCRKD